MVETQVPSASPTFNIGTWVPRSTNIQPVTVTTYDIGVFLPGKTSASQLVLLLPVERTVRFSAGLTPSVASAGTSAAADSVFTLNNNGTQFATLTFHSTRPASLSSTNGTTFN